MDDNITDQMSQHNSNYDKNNSHNDKKNCCDVQSKTINGPKNLQINNTRSKYDRKRKLPSKFVAETAAESNRELRKKNASHKLTNGNKGTEPFEFMHSSSVKINDDFEGNDFNNMPDGPKTNSLEMLNIVNSSNPGGSSHQRCSPRRYRVKKEEENCTGFGIATKNSAVYKYYFPRIQGRLRKVVFCNQMIDIYNQDGWRSSNTEKLKPKAELAKTRKQLRDSKRQIHTLLHELMEGEDAVAETRLTLNEDGTINEGDIFCAVCGSYTCSDENDILLCDLEGCNRGFHMRCLE